MYKNLLFGVIVIFLAFSFSCKKKEVAVPEIVYYSPHENQAFNYDDTISVRCQISDKNLIESVKLELVNSDLVSIGKAFYFYPGSNQFELKTSYPIKPAEISDPENYLLVVATNGTNFKNEYQPVFINVIEKELENIVILSAINTQEVRVSSFYPDADSLVALLDINGDYAGSALNSSGQQLFIGGKEALNLQTYSLIDNQLEWELQPIPFFPMHNANCLHFNDLLFVANNYFNIKAYSISGNSMFTADIGQNEKPGRIFRFNEFLLCDMQSKNGGPTNLVTWYVDSEKEKQRLSTIYEIVDYAAVFEDEIFMAVNSAGTGRLKMYNVELNELTDLAELPVEILSMVKTGEGQVLIGSGQDIYLYSFPGNYPEVVLPGTSAYRLKFENLSQRLYVVGAYAIDVFDFPQLDLYQHIPISDSILNIHFHYNK
jgi:hypothetical protein